MSTLSPLGVEMLLFPTVAAVSGAGALGVPENLDGESLFASMVTGALTSMHGDGLVHPPSPVGEAALVALPVQTAESFGGGANGVVGPGVCGPKGKSCGSLTSEHHGDGAFYEPLLGSGDSTLHKA